MTNTSVRAFDHTVQLSMQWLKDICTELHLDEHDHEKAYVALRATLLALRNRLTIEEAADLSAQLPMLLRGLYYESWRPARVPDKMDRQQFLEAVQKNIGQGPNLGDLHKDPLRVVHCVLAVLQRRVSAGEIAHIINSLPEDMRDLWPVQQRKQARAA